MSPLYDPPWPAGRQPRRRFEGAWNGRTVSRSSWRGPWRMRMGTEDGHGTKGMTREQQIRRRLREWVVQKSGKIGPEDLADDTPFLEQRILSSLQIPDLILFIEEVSGRSIDVERLR